MKYTVLCSQNLTMKQSKPTLPMSFASSYFQSGTYIPASDQEAPVLRHTNVISMNSIALVGLIATLTCSSLRSIVSGVLFLSSH